MASTSYSKSIHEIDTTVNHSQWGKYKPHMPTYTLYAVVLIGTRLV